MTSQRKIEAVRRNGRKSRAPTGTKGKRRARGNARKFGLSVPILVDRRVQAEALSMARAIAGKDTNDQVLAQALVVAEIELDLRRIRRARLTAIEMGMRQAGGSIELPTSSSPQPGGATTALSDGFIKALPDLQAIERYERRAYSRLKKARAHLACLQLTA